MLKEFSLRQFQVDACDFSFYAGYKKKTQEHFLEHLVPVNVQLLIVQCDFVKVIPNNSSSSSSNIIMKLICQYLVIICIWGQIQTLPIHVVIHTIDEIIAASLENASQFGSRFYFSTGLETSASEKIEDLAVVSAVDAAEDRDFEEIPCETKPDSDQSRNGLGDDSFFVWPDRRIPYKIDDGFNSTQKQNILDAVSYYNDIFGDCVQWVPAGDEVPITA